MGTYYLNYLIKTQKFPQSLYHRAKYLMTKELIDSLPPGSLILDAACGIGNVSAPYCKNYQVFGIDLQPEAIEYCQKHHGGEYRVADLYEKLPFSSNFFDLVLFHDSIEHFKDPIKALKELARVLKRERKILISTINYTNPLWFILENTWHRLIARSCKTYSKEVHPTRYTETLLRKHTGRFFKEIKMQKRVLGMELFFLGKKPARL